MNRDCLKAAVCLPEYPLSKAAQFLTRYTDVIKTGY
jgi:hypothetical protein